MIVAIAARALWALAKKTLPTGIVWQTCPVRAQRGGVGLASALLQKQEKTYFI